MITTKEIRIKFISIICKLKLNTWENIRYNTYSQIKFELDNSIYKRYQIIKIQRAFREHITQKHIDNEIKIKQQQEEIKQLKTQLFKTNTTVQTLTHKIQNLKTELKRTHKRTNETISSNDSFEQKPADVCTNKKTYNIINHMSNNKLKSILKENDIDIKNKSNHELKQGVGQLSNRKFERICNKIIHQNQ